jgi:hypothetical protein
LAETGGRFGRRVIRGIAEEQQVGAPNHEWP